MVPEDLEPWVQLSRRELRKKEHSVWLMNRQEEMLIQIKADAATRHAQYIPVSDYPLSARLGKPIREQRLLKNPGIEIWINLLKIGWQGCTPPYEKDCTIRTKFFLCLEYRLNQIKITQTRVFSTSCVLSRLLCL